RIIVVDDGSTDATPAVLAEAALRMPVVALAHRRNRGLGAALATGFTAALADERTEIVVTMDADSTHGASGIAPMLRAIEEGSDVVIASRFTSAARTSGVPLV